jgi:Xaa-Pro dipeptidase
MSTKMSTTGQTRQKEFNLKIERIRQWLNKKGWKGVALSTQALFAWATAGGDNHVNQASDYGIATVLITPETVTVLSNNIEIPRLKAEEFDGIDASKIEFWSCPWYEDAIISTEIRKRMGQHAFGSDAPELPGCTPIGDDFWALTYTLTDREMEQYRVLGRDCSKAMEEALEHVKPGITEHAVGGLICKALLDRSVRPHVILVASDERVFNFRHPPPQAKKVKKHLLAVLCGKRHGLIINLTRMVHFSSKLPPELERKHQACCEVDVAYNMATKVGRPAKDVLADGIKEYERHGFGEEWKLHHQGGPTGYEGRSYRGTPTETRPVLEHQAYAWNPSITGTKSEDTILVRDGSFEFLSGPTSKWPVLSVKRDGKTFKRPAIKLA